MIRFASFLIVSLKQLVDHAIECVHVGVLEFFARLGALSCEFFFDGFGRTRDWFLHAAILSAARTEG